MALPAKSIAIGQPRQLEGIRQKHMIICENEPAELPDDVVRSDTKIDDGIEQWNLNLGNLKERFERGQQDSAVSSQPTSAGIVFEKPSFNVKQTLLAFETKLNNSFDGESNQSNGQHHLLGDGPKSLNGRPVVRKLVNFNGFLNNNSSQEEDSASIQAQNDNKPLPMRRSESLMMRLKKYESRIAGEQVDDDDDDNSDADNSSNDSGTESNTNNNNEQQVPKEKLTPSINLSSLKSKWENGDINKKRKSDGEEEFINGKSKGNLLNKEKPIRNGGSVTASTIAAFRRRSSLVNGGEINNNDADDVEDNNTESIVMSEKDEELIRIRQSLASRKKSGGESIKNIYENAIKEAQMQQQQQSKRNSTDLSAEISTSINQIQKQLLQPKPIVTASATATTLLLDRFNNSVAENNSANNNDNCNQPTPIKDHFQLLTTNKSKANKLKEKFELGLINNNANSDEEDEEGPSNGSKNGSTAINGDSNDKPSLSNLDIIRQEKMDDLSVFIDGEIKAREARHLFQQIDRKISAASKSNQNNNHLTNGITQTKSANVPSRSLAFIGASMRAKLTNHMQENETTPLPETLNASTIDCEDRKKCEGQVKNGSEKEMVKLTTEMQISNTSSSVAKSTKQMQANGTPLPQIAATRPIETTQANNGDTKPQSDFKDAPVAIERKNLVVEKQQSQHQTNGHQPVEEQLEQNQKPLLQQTQSQPQQLQQPPQQQHPQQQKPQKQPKVQKQQKPLNKQQQQPQQPIRLANNVRK